MYLYTNIFKIFGKINIVFKVPHIFHYHNFWLATGSILQLFDCSSWYHEFHISHQTFGSSGMWSGTMDSMCWALSDFWDSWEAVVLDVDAVEQRVVLQVVWVYPFVSQVKYPSS